MKRDRGFLKVTIAMILLILLGIEISMEIRFPWHEAAVVSENTEAILRRIPQVEITEENRAMVEALFQCAVVQELLEGGGNGDLMAADYPELAEAVQGYLDEESAASVVAGYVSYEEGVSLYVGWKDGEGHQFFLERMRDKGEWDYYKLYVPKQKTTYENWDNARARKVVLRRRWFAWLRERMWEE